MKYNKEKVDNGHYIGLTDWLKYHIGEEGVKWRFVPSESRPGHLHGVWFADEKDEVVALLRWL